MNHKLFSIGTLVGRLYIDWSHLFYPLLIDAILLLNQFLNSVRVPVVLTELILQGQLCTFQLFQCSGSRGARFSLEALLFKCLFLSELHFLRHFPSLGVTKDGLILHINRIIFCKFLSCKVPSEGFLIRILFCLCGFLNQEFFS